MDPVKGFRRFLRWHQGILLNEVRIAFNPSGIADPDPHDHGLLSEGLI
jgi:hypothetical protein